MNDLKFFFDILASRLKQDFDLSVSFVLKEGCPANNYCSYKILADETNVNRYKEIISNPKMLEKLCLDDRNPNLFASHAAKTITVKDRFYESLLKNDVVDEKYFKSREHREKEKSDEKHVWSMIERGVRPQLDGQDETSYEMKSNSRYMNSYGNSKTQGIHDYGFGVLFVLANLVDEKEFLEVTKNSYENNNLALEVLSRVSKTYCNNARKTGKGI